MRHLNMKRMEVRIVLLLWIIKLVAGIKANNNNNWQYNDPHYSNAQYAKLIGRVTGGSPGNQEPFGPLQYQYVDYQPNCKSGGQPVCATNGIKYFHFENDCKLEAHNLKLLFQYGTELEPTELERCLPNCADIKCTTKYAPICAAAQSGPHRGQGVTFANECEVRRRECISKETQHVLNNGPCRQQQSKSKSKSKAKSRSKGKRKNRRRGGSSTTSTTATTPIANSNTLKVQSKNKFVKFPALTKVFRATTTTTTTPRPMQFHEYLSKDNPGVSLSRAVNAYDVYNIADVGRDYDEITDSSLTLYLPGIGTVTDTPPKTTSTTTTTTSTTTTTTPKPRPTTLPATSSTVATTLPPTTTTPESIVILVPYTSKSTAIEKASNVTSNVTSKLADSNNSKVSTSGTAEVTAKKPLTVARNAK